MNTRPSRRPVQGRFLTLAWLLAVLGLDVAGLPASVHAGDVVILKSSDIPAYNQAIASFKAGLSSAVNTTEYDVQGDVARGRSLARKIRAMDSSLVLAVGLKAALVAKLELPDVPVLFCMVLDPAKHDLKASNMTGILLEPPIERQLTALRAVLPSARKIGVLFDPDKTAHLVDEARQRAKALGLEMVARSVSGEKEVPAALRSLLPSVEALWLFPDSTVLNEDSLTFLLSSALDANVPVFGFSSDLVRNGALAGLFVSYSDVGRQAARLARKILNQEGLASGTVPPAQTKLAVNLKTAKFLGIAIPPEIIGQVDETY